MCNSVVANKRLISQNNLSGNGDNKEDYSDLPPNQRKKKLQSKLEDLQAKIHQESAARYGFIYFLS